MRRIYGIALSLLLLFSVAGEGRAQRYEPRDTWPYLLADFQEGTVRATDGSLVEAGVLNICIADGSLHYVNESTIMKADMDKVYTAMIGAFVYVNRGGKMYRVLDELSGGAVLQLTEVDYEELNKTDIGYGISSSTASSHHTTLVGMGFDSPGDALYESVERNKASGKVIPTRESLWLLVGGTLIPASRKSFLEYPGIDRDDAVKFLKQNKIKWNKPLSLSKVVEYLAK